MPVCRHPIISMDCLHDNIHGLTPDVAAFLDEWNSPLPYVLAHTSGSTGTPKEIRLLKSDMIKSAEATCEFFSIGPGSLMVCPLSVDYIAGKMMLVRAVVSGAELWMEHPSNRPLGAAYGHIDLVPVVPSQLPGLLESGCDVENVIVGGSPMSPAMEQELANAPFSTYATYGMTETCSHVALRRIGTGCDVYTALPGFCFSVDGDSCLVIESSHMSFGRLVTNDVVEPVDSRHFRWLGRRDNVIMTGGLKVIPEEVERHIRHLVPYPFYIAGRPDEKWGMRVVMYVESALPVDTPELLARLREALPCHAVPKEINVVGRFSTTATGKIKRLLL